MPRLAAALPFGFALLLLLAHAAPAHARQALEEVEYLDWGLLSLRSHAPLFQPRLSYTAGRVDALRHGQFEFTLAYSHTNAWGERVDYRIDGEFARLELQAQAGLGNGFELGVIFTLANRDGGFLDGFIMDFHDLFGITQARRDTYPLNELRVEIDYERDGEYDIILDDSDRGLGIANPVLLLKHEVLSQMRWRPAVSVELGIKLPLGDIERQFATGGWALMLHVGVRQPITAVDWLQLIVVGGFVCSPGEGNVLGFPARDFQWTLVVGPEFRIAPNATVVLYWMRQTGASRRSRFNPQQRSTNEFLFGVLWAPSGYDDWVVEFGMIENSINDANTPDFGLHVAIRARFE